MRSRLFIAGIFIPMIIWIVLFSPDWFFLLGVEFVICAALYEFYKMIQSKSIKVYMRSGILIGALIPISYFMAYSNKLKYEKFTYFAIVLIIIYLISKQVIKGEIKEAVREISYTLFGILYIALLFSHVLFMKNLSLNPVNVFGLTIPEGRLWVMSAFFMVWASDSAAYFIGITFGKNKILPKISPKKSVEGSIAGLIAPVAMMFLLKYWLFPAISIFDVVAIGVIVGIFGQLGDFGESLFKREFEIKDSSNILMGHGGMWDRFDSLIFVAPLLYYYIKIFIY